MKNAFVLQHHIGDNGNVTEGMILTGVARKRFDVLEKKGLVREATAEEVEEGFKPPFLESSTDFAGHNGDGDSDGAQGDDGSDGHEGSTKSASPPANKAAPQAKNK